MAEMQRRPSRTQFVRLRDARFVLNGGTPEEYEPLIRALGRSLGREPLGPLMVAKKTGSGGWLVLGRDQRSCLEVLACLQDAGIMADVLHHPD
jgi:hypothetical protein